jgi:predicted phage baseplate assembly protein
VWIACFDLLKSQHSDQHFVVEMDNDGRAHLRFGDDEAGAAPTIGATFSASYRVGNGSSGNIGAGAIHSIVTRSRLTGVRLRPRNPLPTQGGTPPEPLREVKLFAPYAHRANLERAVTADDYARLVERELKDQVARAAATLRWTGSYYEVLVTVDSRGKREPDSALLEATARMLSRYRRIGHEIAVAKAKYVFLDLEMSVCVRPEYAQGRVKAALLDRLSDRELLDGRRGFFHPDNLTFGEGVAVSRLIAEAHAVRGVESVNVTKLERLFEGANGELERAILSIGPMEIVRLDNDPSFPEHGRLRLVMRGGR